MKREEAYSLIERLPKDLKFFYFRDREAAWLLLQLIDGSRNISDLRKTRYGKLLQRPLIKECISIKGDGKISAEDLLPAAEPDTGVPEGGWSRSQAAVLESSYDNPWHDFRISFDIWDGESDPFAQVSRPGVNVVMQLSFSSDHSAYLGKLRQDNARERFEFEEHPIRVEGNPTLAWARLDIDAKSRTALIEEIQSDWLRIAKKRVQRLAKYQPESYALQIYRQYLREIEDRYARDWPRATMLVALKILVKELGCRTIYFHTPESGEALKHNHNAPKSLYTDLPTHFCFAKTKRWPPFIRRSVRKLHGNNNPTGDIQFWVLKF
ncbi:hypothetical protein [Nitratireductor sp. XY-223]|uniref:hypothetical protein n=1 Tax=Nitratireductor sp. XY-223 TaxID=2561926 RepID=UPI0010AA00ED|nr:hypothetical protein [Nitratireductor sp. XY-223]